MTIHIIENGPHPFAVRLDALTKERDALAARLAEAVEGLKADWQYFAFDEGPASTEALRVEALLTKLGYPRQVTPSSAPAVRPVPFRRCSHKFNEWSQCELPAGHDGVHWLTPDSAYDSPSLHHPNCERLHSDRCTCNRGINPADALRPFVEQVAKDTQRELDEESLAKARAFLDTPDSDR